MKALKRISRTRKGVQGFIVIPETERFWMRVNRNGENGCWIWMGANTGAKKYGRFTPRKGVRVMAHRFAYELLVGPIPDGLVLDHLCRNKACVNPAHLEPVTPSENMLRGESPTAVARRTNRCRNGHEFSHHDGRQWVCKTCSADASRRAREKKKAASQ